MYQFRERNGAGQVSSGQLYWRVSPGASASADGGRSAAVPRETPWTGHQGREPSRRGAGKGSFFFQLQEPSAVCLRTKVW